MPTRGARFLRERGIPFEIRRYEHDEKGAVFAAQAIGFPVEQTVKTLVVELSSDEEILVLMPGDAEVDVKKLAKGLKVKRASLVDQRTAERVTGYLIGGISPFGIKRPLRIVMERRLLRYPFVAINAGGRGVMAVLNPQDVIRAVGAQPLSVAAAPS